MKALTDTRKGKAVRNEVLKVRATFLNSLAAATIAVGVVTPIAAAFLADDRSRSRRPPPCSSQSDSLSPSA